MKYLTLLGLVLSLMRVEAQDPEFSHYYNSMTYLNPAMAARDTMDYAQYKYRNQWPSLSGTFVTHYTDYAHYFPKLNAAAYMSLSSDLAGNILGTNRVSLGYSQKVKLKGCWGLQAGLELTYFERVLDWEKLTFGDLIDPRRGFIYSGGQPIGDGRAQGLDVSAGALVTCESFYVGFSGHHINQPNQSVIEGESRLPFKWGIQTGYKHLWDKFGIEPYAFYRQQASFNQLLGGINLSYAGFTIGYAYRAKDAMIGLAGYDGKRFRVFYSYDATISKLGTATTGSHELSLGLKFWKKPMHTSYFPFR